MAVTLTYDAGDAGIVNGYTGTIGGITNPSKIMGIAVANITSINGIT